MEFVSTTDAPKPAGHYSQGVVHNGLVYVSGQVPIHPESGALAGYTIEEQAEQVFQNVQGVLRGAGSDLDGVLKVTIFVTDASHWGAVNDAFSRAFGDHRPARAVIPCGKLPRNFLIEVEAIAAVKE